MPRTSCVIYGIFIYNLCRIVCPVDKVLFISRHIFLSVSLGCTNTTPLTQLLPPCRHVCLCGLFGGTGEAEEAGEKCKCWRCLPRRRRRWPNGNYLYFCGGHTQVQSKLKHSNVSLRLLLNRNSLRQRCHVEDEDAVCHCQREELIRGCARDNLSLSLFL